MMRTIYRYHTRTGLVTESTQVSQHVYQVHRTIKEALMEHCALPAKEAYDAATSHLLNIFPEIKNTWRQKS